MLVYRICDKKEIDQIFNTQSFDTIGCAGEDTLGNKNHYIPHKLYMHFFPKKSYLMLLDTSKDRCICTYDIPEDILKSHLGTGKYYDYMHYTNLWEIPEYAIESEIICLDYLEKVDLILEYIDIEDYWYDVTLNSFLETIYIKPKSKIKKYIKTPQS